MTGSGASGRAMAAELVQNRNPRQSQVSRRGVGGSGGTEAADGEAAQKRVPLGGVSGLDMGSSPLGSCGLPLPAICLGKPPEDKRQGELHSRQN